MLDKVLEVFLLTRALDVGGAERQLVLLAKGLKARGHKVSVGVFYAGGALDAELQESGIEIVDFGKAKRWDVIPFMRRVVGELRRRRPDVVYGFLGSGNVVATAARPFVGKTCLVWSVRASNMDLRKYDWLARLWYKIECRLSRYADAIIANSSAGADFAVRNGFPRSKLVVIPNGIDTDRFRPDHALRSKQRAAFRLRDEQIAIGVLARLDPMKGHEILLQAAPAVLEKRPNVRFFCIGEGPELDHLRQMAADLGLSDRINFTGRHDPAAALNALDISCSCSLFGEGFSNAVAEAMACGLPCVVTDVGDSRAIVGEFGTVVPPRSPEALAAALVGLIASPDGGKARSGRERIVAEFSIDAMVDRTLQTFQSVLSRHHRGARTVGKRAIYRDT